MLYDINLIHAWLNVNPIFHSPNVKVQIIKAFADNYKIVLSEKELSWLYQACIVSTFGDILANECILYEVRSNNLIVLKNQKNQIIKIYKNDDIKQKSGSIPEKV